MTRISIKNLANAIYESSYDKKDADLNDVLAKTVVFMRDKNLISKKEEILYELEKIINQKEGILKIKVSSKDKLNSGLESEIKNFIKDRYKTKEVEIETYERKELLGGIKIEVGDDIIDTTLSNKIHQLQNYLITN